MQKGNYKEGQEIYYTYTDTNEIFKGKILKFVNDRICHVYSYKNDWAVIVIRKNIVGLINNSIQKLS